jgi:hypothetical protein
MAKNEDTALVAFGKLRFESRCDLKCLPFCSFWRSSAIAQTRRCDTCLLGHRVFQEGATLLTPTRHVSLLDTDIATLANLITRNAGNYNEISLTYCKLYHKTV